MKLLVLVKDAIFENHKPTNSFIIDEKMPRALEIEEISKARGIFLKLKITVNLYFLERFMHVCRHCSPPN